MNKYHFIFFLCTLQLSLLSCRTIYRYNSNCHCTPKDGFAGDLETFPKTMLIEVARIDTTKDTLFTLFLPNGIARSYSFKAKTKYHHVFDTDKRIGLTNGFSYGVGYYPNKTKNSVWRAIGMMRVGEQLLFDETGKIIEKINYDKKYPICWREALLLARKLGYDNAFLYRVNNNSKWWLSVDIKGEKRYLLIDVYTGKAELANPKFIE
jgi:hypothetical protein